VGLLQSHVGHRSGDREAGLSGAAKAITVHSLIQATAAAAAAAETGCPVLLLSAPSAAGAAGPAWFQVVLHIAADAHPGAVIEGVLDCGAMPGHALSALRQGLKAIRYDGPSFEAVSDIAAQCGATVMRGRPRALDLAGDSDTAALIEACRHWLREGRTTAETSP
jgi:hypothetical protein